jgi:hypothetical protein
VTSLTNTAPSAPPPSSNLLQDLWLLVFNPYRLFFNLPRVNRGGPALLLLVLTLAAIGWVTGEIGVHERLIRDAAAQDATRQLINAKSEENQAIALENAELTEKSADFTVLMSKTSMIVGPPLRVLMTVGFIGGVLFGVVALGGGKPKMALLSAIVTFSSFVEIPRQILRAYLIAETHQTRVETSLAALPSHLATSNVSLPMYLLLRQLDPFNGWFWVLFVMGIRYSARFSLRPTILLTLFLMLVTCSLRVAEDVLELAWFQISFESPQ